jgi:fatty-acyl-CoA synthase
MNEAPAPAPAAAVPGAAAARQAWLRALEAVASIDREPLRTLPVRLEELAQRQPDAPALLSDDQSLSYAQLLARSRRYARWAQQAGLVRGAVVALVMENAPEYFALWLGLTRAGVVVALLNTQLRGPALRHALGLAAPRHVFVGASLWPGLAAELSALAPQADCWRCGPAAAPGEDERLETALAALDDAPLTAQDCPPPALGDTALYIYTSGTTGLPKAARVSHRRVLQWSCWFAGLAGMTPQDRMYDCLPMYHSVGGVVAPGAALVAGASVVVRARFSARRFWDDVARWQCTVFQYIGELCRILVHEAPHPLERTHALRLACGNGLAAEVWEPFRARFGIGQILEFYAATEANFSLFNVEGQAGALGRVPPFFAHRLPIALVRHEVESGLPARDSAGHCIPCATGEAGEALCRVAGAGAGAGQRFEGYTDAAASEAKVLRDVFAPGDLWYRSGDLMRRDAAGFYYFVDRIGDTFRWKGENVSTTEVAGVLCAAPGVLEALVYGVTVAGHDGRAGMAALLTDARFELDALWRHVEAALPRYARPLFLRRLGAVDRTGTFKAGKQELAKDGFDPAVSSDPLLVADGERCEYVPLDGEIHARILQGAWRFP